MGLIGKDIPKEVRMFGRRLADSVELLGVERPNFTGEQAAKLREHYREDHPQAAVHYDAILRRAEDNERISPTHERVVAEMLRSPPDGEIPRYLEED
jgi:hypothetical protein